MENYKKTLLILNPFAGQKKANSAMADIIQLFTANNYMTTVMTTLRRGDGTRYAQQFAGDFDLIVAIGGDGSFNEVVSGVVQSGEKTMIGYIPAGSTNDFAESLKLKKDILEATNDIIQGYPMTLDVGSFNGRLFTYVASFGAFTRASYETSQDVKNALGYLAYILSGLSSIADIKPIHMKVEVDDKTIEDNFIFGAISNSTSMGGVLKLNSGLVDMADGKFEMLLVKTPNDLFDMAEILRGATESDFENNDMFVFLSGSEFRITSFDRTDWSLDGEYQEGVEDILIRNIPKAIHLMVSR